MVLPLLVVGCTLGDDRVASSPSRAPAPVDDRDELPAYVAQCEAVLGPIPEISCDPAHPAPGTQVSQIPVFVDGKLLGFTPATAAADRALLDQRAAQQRYTCDFPSIGGDFPCTVGSTLVRYQSPDNPNVQWVGLCRGVPRDNPGYDRFIGNGLIGANVKTGEMCFFFGLNPDRDAPYRLPRLTRDAPSSDALAPWVRPTEMPGSCLSCHPNNDPWIFTPWLMPAYMRPVITDPGYALDLRGIPLDDVFAARHIVPTPSQLQTMLPPPLPAGRTAWTEDEILDPAGTVLRRQYRAVGSSYIAAETAGTVQPRTGIQPTSWKTPFRDRLKLQPMEASCSRPCHATGNEHWVALASDSTALAKYSHYGTETASTVHWMPYAWKPDAYEVPAITECPIPKQVALPTAQVRCDASGPVVELAWSYANDFGGVPDRDDVRFDVAIAPGDAPALGIASAREGARMEAAVIARDLAPASATDYRYTTPVPRGVVAIAIQPKRFCFEEPDRRPFAYAVPTRITVDASCD